MKIISILPLLIFSLNSYATNQYDLVWIDADNNPQAAVTAIGYEGFHPEKFENQLFNEVVGTASTLYTSLTKNENTLSLIFFFDYPISHSFEIGPVADISIHLDQLSSPPEVNESIWIPGLQEDDSSLIIATRSAAIEDHTEINDAGDAKIVASHQFFDLFDYFALENMTPETTNWSINIELNEYNEQFINSWKYLNADGTTIDLKIEDVSGITLSGLAIPEPATVGLISCLSLVLFLRKKKHK